MDIQELRKEIDRIDSEIIRLYGERMETARRIGQYKKEHNLPVTDTEREREVLNRAGREAGEANENGVRALFGFLMAQSRTNQLLESKEPSEMGKMIRESLENTPQLFPEKETVACQGVEGAYSQQACEKIFRSPSIMYCRTFENVFAAIESGLCRYGILPIENSLAGSVNSVYDQLISRKCYIVRSARVKIEHTLLAAPGVRMEDIREIWSHEQAISQCSAFLTEQTDQGEHQHKHCRRGPDGCGERTEGRGGDLLCPLRGAVRTGDSEDRYSEQQQQPYPVHLHFPPTGDLSRGGPNHSDAGAAEQARRAVSAARPLLRPGDQPYQAGKPPRAGKGF